VGDPGAGYQYYLHGPLKRAEIGQDKIQGLDYAYTLQGWLRELTHTMLIQQPLTWVLGGSSSSHFLPDAFAT
jgi:hypothetical protein